MAAETTCVHPELFWGTYPIREAYSSRVKPPIGENEVGQVDKIRSIDRHGPVCLLAWRRRHLLMWCICFFLCFLCVYVTLCIIPHPIQLKLFLSYLSSERSYILWTYWHCVHKHLMCIRSLLLSDAALNASIFAKANKHNLLATCDTTHHKHHAQLLFLIAW